MEFYKEHSTEEMAEILGRMSKGGENLTPEELKEISDGLYWLEAAAENPYNSDYFRTLFRALDNICNYDYMENLMTVIDDVIGYFDYHNKNLTKAQDWKLDELREIYRKIRNEK